MVFLQPFLDAISGKNLSEIIEYIIIFYQFALTTLFHSVYDIFMDFFNGSWFDFSDIGRSFVGTIIRYDSFEFFTHDFFYWFIGVIFAVFIIRFVFGFISNLIHLIK